MNLEKFNNFLKTEYSNWKHIILDGNKFVDRELRSVFVRWKV